MTSTGSVAKYNPPNPQWSPAPRSVPANVIGVASCRWWAARDAELRGGVAPTTSAVDPTKFRAMLITRLCLARTHTAPHIASCVAAARSATPEHTIDPFARPATLLLGQSSRLSLAAHSL